MKERLTAVVCCSVARGIGGWGSAPSSALEIAGAYDDENYVMLFKDGEVVSSLKENVLGRSPLAAELLVFEESHGFDVRLSSAHGPGVDGSALVTDALRDGDIIYIVPSRYARVKQKLGLPAALRTDLLREMLELDPDNLRWIMEAILKRRGPELKLLEKQLRPGSYMVDTLLGKCSSVSDNTLETSRLSADKPRVIESLDMFTDEVIRNGATSLKSKQFDDDGLRELLEDEEEIKQNPVYTPVDVDGLQRLINNRSVDLHGRPGQVLPMVQFGQSTYYVVEGTPSVEISVLRIGHLDQEASVGYWTSDASAVAGKKYKGESGVLKFAKGESEQKIHVEIFSNDAFDVILEFNIVLGNAVGCLLSHNHSRSRVMIIDDDFFPSNRLKQSVADGHLEHVSVRLFFEFVKQTFSDETVKRGSIKVLFVDIFENIRFLVSLVIRVFLLDFILAPRTDEDLAPSLLLFVAVSSLTLFLCSHITKYRKCFWQIGGKARKNLLRNLMRKFLHYSKKSRSLIIESDIMLLISRDVDRVVDDLYMQVLIFVQHILKIVAIVFYQLAMPHVYNACGLEKTVTLQGTMIGLAPILVHPLCMGLFLFVRNKGVKRVLVAEEDAKSSLIESANEIIQTYNLIAGYHLRGSTIDGWEASVAKWTRALRDEKACHCNNLHFAPWLTEIIIAIWVLLGGMLVKHNATEGGAGMSIADFLVTWTIFKNVGDAWANMYVCVLTVQESIPSLQKLTVYMNLATDCRDRLATNEMQEQLAQSTMNSMGTRDVDRLPVSLSHFEFKHKAGPKFFGGLNIDIRIPQGGLYLVLGGRGSGKSTLLNILGRMVLPYKEKMDPLESKIQNALYRDMYPFAFNEDGQDGIEDLVAGECLIPGHLRVLHVPAHPHFLKGTLFDNLTLGVHGDSHHKQHLEERVFDICKRLALPEHIIEEIKHKCVHSWSTCLAQSHQELLSIARAIIMNPDVLVLHKPMQFLNRTSSKHVITILREFVNNRGHGDLKDFWKRRPRTCFLTGSVQDGHNIADVVFHVKDGVTPLVMRKDYNERWVD